MWEYVWQNLETWFNGVQQCLTFLWSPVQILWVISSQSRNMYIFGTGLSVCLNYMLWWCYTHLRYKYTPNPTLMLWHGLTNQCFDECREKRLNIISHISSNTCMDNQWTVSPLENGTSGYFTKHNCYAKFPATFQPLPASSSALGGGKYNLYRNYSPFFFPLLSTVRICEPLCLNGMCVNGTCTGCPEGFFGVNCTSESYVIKLCS